MIEDEAKNVFAFISKTCLFNTDRILFLEELEKEFPNIRYLIPYLYSQNIAVTWDWKGKEVIKFRSDFEAKIHLSDVDHGIISLKSTQETLQLQLDKINESIVSYKQSAIKAGKEGNKPLAYSFIRRKKQLEQISDNRHSALETIVNILLSIQNSETDKDILEAFKLGNNSLTNVVKENGVNVEKVDDILIDMQQVFQDQQDIDMAIVEANEKLFDVDESDLLEELEKLNYEEEEPIKKETHPILIIEKQPITIEQPQRHPQQEEDRILEKELDDLVNSLPDLRITEGVEEERERKKVLINS